LIALIIVVLIAAVPLVLYVWLPKTSAGWFTYKTGLTYPPDAVVLRDTRHCTLGMIETFASEGTSVFSFSTDPGRLGEWTSRQPPWAVEWQHGEVTNRKRFHDDVPAGAVYWVMRGDAGNGDLLVVDPEAATVWLFAWAW
jgi:hypothetical protein